MRRGGTPQCYLERSLQRSKGIGPGPQTTGDGTQKVGYSFPGCSLTPDPTTTTTTIVKARSSLGSATKALGIQTDTFPPWTSATPSRKRTGHFSLRQEEAEPTKHLSRRFVPAAKLAQELRHKYSSMFCYSITY